MYARLLTTATDQPIEFACEAGPDADPLANARTVAAGILGDDLGHEIDPDDLHRYGILIEA